MRKGTVLFCLLLSFNARGLDKSALDIHESRDELSKSGSLNSTTFGHRFLSTDFLEMSLMTGGAFTLGTNQGLSAGPFDDQAPLSFGHPYALTSYPLVAWDGQWKRLDQWFSDWEQIAPQAGGGGLFVDAVFNGQLHINFALQPLDNGRTMTATLTAENLDGAAHTLGLGLVYDPAMGPGGDGFATIGGQVIKNPTLITAAGALATFTMNERPQAPLGLTLAVSADAAPDRALVDNWPEIYADNSLMLPSQPTVALFDVCLKLIWDEKSLAPGAKRIVTIRFNLTPPNFSSAAFIRWDMPSALTLENNLLFPRKLMTTAPVMNTGSYLDNLQLAVTFPKELSGTESSAPFSTQAGSSAFLPVQVNSKEIYEDKIVPVTLTVHRGTEIIDQLLRYVYIPATPVSDVGLTVTIDSVMIDKHPQVSLVMHGEVTETGAKLLNLLPENVFLYENDRRISEFEMKKFSGGGASLADVCFVLDISGSMGDNINQVRNNIGEFADVLAQNGFDFRVAVVPFCDYVDDRWMMNFTTDIEAVKRNLANIILWGGTEDSPGAMQYAADNLSWREGSKRTIIWVTDEPYPENILKRQPLINTLLAKGITIHGVGPLELQTDWFNPIVLPTGGNFYNITGNFRDVLLDVARMKSEDRYLINYTSQVSRADFKLLSVQVRYAGLGGQAQFTIGGGNRASLLTCFPNPFNPTVTLRVLPFKGQRVSLEIYNVLGQRVRSFDVPPATFTDIVWDARDERGFPVSAGLYVVTLFIDAQKSAEQQKQRILYLK